jgi:hypothetical protein
MTDPVSRLAGNGSFGMDLIYPHMSGALAPVHRTLRLDEALRLQVHYTHGGSAPQADALLRHIWEARLWVACACRAPSPTAALLFVRRVREEEFVLVRMNDRAPHDSRCPFAGEPALAAATDRTPPLPTLATLLYRWFGAAKLHTIYPAPAGDLLHGQYESLREVSRSLETAPGRRLYAGSRTHPDGLAALLQGLLERPPSHGQLYPDALYLHVVRALTAEEFEAIPQLPQNHPASPVKRVVLADLERLSGCDSDFEAHAILFGFGVDPVTQRVRAQGVWALPVYSRTRLVPLTRPAERATLRVLLAVQQSMVRAEGSVTVIRKTLPGTPIEERGIAFQMMRLGSHGRPLAAVDVVCLEDPALETETTACEETTHVLRHAAQSQGGLRDARFAERLQALLEPRSPPSPHGL